jgi:hypothetical protein
MLFDALVRCLPAHGSLTRGSRGHPKTSRRSSFSMEDGGKETRHRKQWPRFLRDGYSVSGFSVKRG